MILVNIATTLFPGILFQLFVLCILLNFSSIPLCINVDEHNADNLVKRYIKSTLIIVTVIVNIIFEPVKAINNPLDEK